MDGRIFAALSRAASAGKPGASDAKKQQGNDCKKKERQRCSNDAAECKALLPAACNNDPACIVEASLCCDECTANGFLTCLIAASASAVASFE